MVVGHDNMRVTRLGRLRTIALKVQSVRVKCFRAISQKSFSLGIKINSVQERLSESNFYKTTTATVGIAKTCSNSMSFLSWPRSKSSLPGLPCM